MTPADRTGPATGASYDSEADRFSVELRNGALLGIPRDTIPALAGRRRSKKLAAVRVAAGGTMLEWPELGLQLDLTDLQSWTIAQSERVTEMLDQARDAD